LNILKLILMHKHPQTRPLLWKACGMSLALLPVWEPGLSLLLWRAVIRFNLPSGSLETLRVLSGPADRPPPYFFWIKLNFWKSRKDPQKYCFANYIYMNENTYTLYIYIYIYIHTYIYTHINIYIWMKNTYTLYIYIHTYIYIWMKNTYTLYIYTYLFIYTYICTHMYIHIYIYINMYIYKYTHIYIDTYY